MTIRIKKGQTGKGLLDTVAKMSGVDLSIFQTLLGKSAGTD